MIWESFMQQSQCHVGDPNCRGLYSWVAVPWLASNWDMHSQHQEQCAHGTHAVSVAAEIPKLLLYKAAQSVAPLTVPLPACSSAATETHLIQVGCFFCAVLSSSGSKQARTLNEFQL